MSQQPQGPGWWQASDGRWYPPQPQQYPTQQYTQQQYGQQQYGPPQQQYQPPRKSGNRGCLIAVAIVLAVVLIGGGIAAYFVYQAVHKVAEVAGGVAGGLGPATCLTEQDVSTIVGSPVALVSNSSLVVASGCSYVGSDRTNGVDVQITTGPSLIASDEIKSFASEAANEGTQLDPIPVGDGGQAYGGDRKSGAITVSNGKLIEVEVFGASEPVGDKKAAAVALLQRVVGA